jgi:hypothetical protein
MNHFHPQLLKYNAGTPQNPVEGGASQAMKDWLKANQVAMEIRHSDWPLVEGLHVGGALYGVWLRQGSTGRVGAPQIQQSSFNSCSKGVYSNEASNAPAEVSLTENNFGGCGTAVYLKGVGRVTISNNVFWNSAAHHVELVSPLHFDVDGNTASIWGNNYSFLKVSGTGSKYGSVSGNAGGKATGAIPAAIDVANSTRVVVVANTFEISSSYPVVRFQSTTSNSIAGANRGGSGVQNLGTSNSVWP